MKFKWVDALRGYAVLAVLFVHCREATVSSFPGPAILSNIFFQGSRGVQLFYVASAFTLFLSMGFRAKDEINPNKNFFIRRFFRIAPMFYLALVYYLWQNGLSQTSATNGEEITINNILSHFLFLNGFHPNWINSIVPGCWSIAVEMMFYCFVPFLFAKIKSINQALLFVFFALVIRDSSLLVFKLLHLDETLGGYLHYYLPNQLPVFGLGIVLYFLIKDNGKFDINSSWYLIAFGLIIFQLLGFNILPEYFLYSVSFVFLAIGLSKSPNIVIVNRPIIYVGKISYSMYLVHSAVIFWLAKFNMLNFFVATNMPYELLNFLIRFLLIILVTSIISSLSYRYIELPMQKIGKQIILKTTPIKELKIN
jgi:peptidoglycan/LPS O-acetylase OafA/YrhL